MKKFLFFTLMLFAAASCSKGLKKRFGLLETIPDEYQVQSNKPLEVPPHYDIKSTKHRHNTEKLNKLSDTEKALLEEVK